MEEFLTTQDIMRILKISKTKALRLFSSLGEDIGAFKINGEWRVEPNDLRAFIERVKKTPDRAVMFNMFSYGGSHREKIDYAVEEFRYIIEMEEDD